METIGSLFGEMQCSSTRYTMQPRFIIIGLGACALILFGLHYEGFLLLAPS